MKLPPMVSARLFLVTKLAAGQMNPSMDVSLELKRELDSKSTDKDYLSVLVKLKRTDVGRVRINDVVLKVVDLTDTKAKPLVATNSRIVTENRIIDHQLSEVQSTERTVLPPGDGTQLAYFLQVKRDTPILVDATIIGRRTGPWIEPSQWRASAISLPGKSGPD